jgi:hypothetical protein
MILRGIIVLLGLVLVLSYNACGQLSTSLPSGTTTGNPFVSLGSKPFTPTAGTVSFSGCLTEVIGMPLNSKSQLWTGAMVVDVDPAGFNFPQLFVDSDGFDAMILHFSPGTCAGFASSLEVVNANGTNTQNTDVELRFSSSVEMIRNGQWWVHFDNWSAALSLVNSSQDVADLANIIGNCNH